MILVRLRDQIVAGLKDAVPALVEVKAHGGRFDLEAIKACAARPPAARVACLGLRDFTFEGAVCTADSMWAVFIVTADQVGATRDAVALGLISAIAPIAPANCWTLDREVDGARQIRADNLLSAALDKIGIALWAVSFIHRVEFDRANIAMLNDFLRAYINYDLAPTDGTIEASDHIDLPPVP